MSRTVAVKRSREARGNCWSNFWSNLWTELYILVGSKTKTLTRLWHWKGHVNTYARLGRERSTDAELSGASSSVWKTERIDFATGHLDTLDTKFGFLLAVQAFLAAGVGFAVNAFPWDKLTKATDRLFHVPQSLWLVFILGLADRGNHLLPQISNAFRGSAKRGPGAPRSDGECRWQTPWRL